MFSPPTPVQGASLARAARQPFVRLGRIAEEPVPSSVEPIPRHQKFITQITWNRVCYRASNNTEFTDLKKIIEDDLVLSQEHADCIKNAVNASRSADVQAFIVRWNRMKRMQTATIYALTFVSAALGAVVLTVGLLHSLLLCVPILCAWVARNVGSRRYTWSTFMFAWVAVALLYRFMLLTPCKMMLGLLWRLMKLGWGWVKTVFSLLWAQAWAFLRFLFLLDLDDSSEPVPEQNEEPTQPAGANTTNTTGPPCSHSMDFCEFQAFLKDVGGLANLKNFMGFGLTALLALNSSYVFVDQKGITSPILTHEYLPPQDAQSLRMVRRTPFGGQPTMEMPKSKYEEHAEFLHNQSQKIPDAPESNSSWFYTGGVWVLNAFSERLMVFAVRKTVSWAFHYVAGMTRQNWADFTPVVVGVLAGPAGAWTVENPDLTIRGVVAAVVGSVAWKLSEIFLHWVLQAPVPAPVQAPVQPPVPAQAPNPVLAAAVNRAAVPGP